MLVDLYRKWRRVSAIHEPSATMLSKAEFKRELTRERIRSTRRSFPFCVLEIRLPDRTNRRVCRRYSRVITNVLNRNVRLTDHKAHLDSKTFAVLFTDTPEMGGRAAMDRIEQLLQSRDVAASLRLEVFDPEGFGDGFDGDNGFDRDNGFADEDGFGGKEGSEFDDASSRDSGSDGPGPIGGQRRSDGPGQRRQIYRSSLDVNHQSAPAVATLSPPQAQTEYSSVSDDPTWRRFDGRVEIGREIPSSKLSLPSRFVKRSVDIAGASFGLVFGGPVILGAMAIIRITDGQAAIFKQTREGHRGKPFTIYKLRTMVVDAEAKQKDLRKLSHRDGPAFKMKYDPRVTKVGHVLRKTCLDELPQLWNVLKGEMSLVGPRPLPWHESRACSEWHRRRLDVRPGLTCFWQVDKDQVETFDDWMRMDLQYLEESSLWVDLRLIVRTIAVPILGRGSH